MEIKQPEPPKTIMEQIEPVDEKEKYMLENKDYLLIKALMRLADEIQKLRLK